MEVNLFFIGVVFLFGLVIAYFFGRYLKNSEVKDHRRDAVARSRAILGGQFAEQLSPFLPGFKYSPNECRFIGKPIDFVVFKGADGKKIEEVVFVEVKSGKSRLSPFERKLKEAVEGGRVRWEEYRVDGGLVGEGEVEDIAWRK
jgi:predicted Holliday junction resolvase-like endonuclease|tara:strand:+ start:2925 stop:3356 length:432 start_codon:yes stop_codon:yes gene_type:complete